MSLAMRVLLLVGAIGTLFYFLKKIRKNKLDIDYSIFWILFGGVLAIVSIFPGIITWASDLLGVLSPANMVFLLVIFLLIIKLFSITVKLSITEHKLRKMAQYLAIREKEISEKNEDA